MTIDYEALLAPLTDQKLLLLQTREQLQERIIGINAELQQIDKLLKAGGLIETPPPKKTRARPGIRKVDDLEAYVREHHANGNGFGAPDLMGKGFSNHLIYNGLKVLQERGVVRLDRMDGMAKIFKLVSP